MQFADVVPVAKTQFHQAVVAILGLGICRSLKADIPGRADAGRGAAQEYGRQQDGHGTSKRPQEHTILYLFVVSSIGIPEFKWKSNLVFAVRYVRAGGSGAQADNRF